MKKDVKLISKAIEDFLNVINNAYMYFEIETVDDEKGAYPFYKWLNDLTEELSNYSSDMWKIFYGYNKEVSK